MFSVRNRTALVWLIAIVASSTSVFAQGGPGAQSGRRPGGDPITSIEERTNGLKKIDGFFPLYWDEAAGTLWLEIPAAQHRSALLDRTGAGPRLERHRARSRQPDRLAHRDVRARRPEGADGAAELRLPRAEHEPGRSARGARRVRALGAVGLHGRRRDGRPACSSTSPTSWCVTRTDIAGRLRPGSYRFDATRSAIYMPMTMNFPKNTEMEAELTFVAAARRARSAGAAGAAAAESAGRSSRASGASRRRPEAASIRVHHSFVELPDANYKPRRLRSALRLLRRSTSENYSAPLGQPMTQRFIAPPPAAEE